MERLDYLKETLNHQLDTLETVRSYIDWLINEIVVEEEKRHANKR